MIERTGSLPFSTIRSAKWHWVLALIGLLGPLFVLGGTMLRSFVSGIVSILLFPALAILGVAYGLWSQQAQVTGATAIGSLNVFWDDPCTCSDPRTVCKINPFSPEIIDVAVKKGYPHYTSVCSLALKNLGSVPVKITSRKVIPESIIPASATSEGDEAVQVNFEADFPFVVIPNEQQVSDLEIIIEDGAQQNSTYQFSVQVNVQPYP